MPLQPDGEVPLKSPSALKFLRSLSLSHCLSQLHRRINEEKASKFGFLLLAQLKHRLSGKRASWSALETAKVMGASPHPLLGEPVPGMQARSPECGDLWTRFQQLQKGKDGVVIPQLASEQQPSWKCGCSRACCAISRTWTCQPRRGEFSYAGTVQRSNSNSKKELLG